MSVAGLGVDVVDIARFASVLTRTPGFADRVLTPAEHGGRPAQLAARFAAKEALAKALGAPSGLRWHDVEVVSDVSGAPTLAVRGSVAAACQERGVHAIHLSLTHDAGVAVAVVVLES